MAASRNSLSRRDFLKIAGTASGALLLAGCAPPSPSLASLPVTLTHPLKTNPLVIPKTMGVNVQFLGDRTDIGEIEALVDGGFGFLRVDFIWGNVEKTAGEYDFEKYLRHVSQFTEIGIRCMLILDYGNPLYDNGGPPISDAARLGFARYLNEVARAFKDKLVIWEIWNEPDQKGFWPEPDPVEYSQLARLALETLRKVDPQAAVMAPAISNLKDANAIRFIDELGQRGTLRQLDGISVHPYRYPFPEQSRADFLHIRRLIDSYSPNKTIPIVWGESGYNETDVGEEGQAVLAIRQYLFSLTLDAPYTNWYNWRDYESASQSGALYGMVRLDLEPKLAYRASRALANNLNGFEFLRRLPVEDENDYVLLFYKSGQYALAAWTTNRAHSIQIGSMYTSPQISELLGERKPGEEATYPQVLISASPLFIKCKIADGAAPIIWKPVGSVQSLNLDNPEIHLRIFNTTSRQLQIKLRIQSEWITGATSLAPTPGEAQYNIPVSLLYPASAPSAAVIEISSGQSARTEGAFIWLSPFTAKESVHPV